jgi:two-component system, OmpR family, sensor kinase
MSRIPIRLRLTLAFALAMGVVLAGMALLVYLRVGTALLASVDQTLRSQSREAQLHSDGDQRLVDRDIAGGTTLAQVIDANGRVERATPAGLPPLLGPSDAARAAAGRTVLQSVTLRTPAGDWRILAAPTPGGTSAVVVARSLAPREATLHRLFRELVLGGALALLLASVAGYGLAAAALRPVEAMRRRAAAVTAASPTRLPVPAARDEIARLATTLNEMLARLESAFEHERRFVADASHELRTPLALLRAELELALRRPRSAAELELAVRSAVEETERLSRLAEDLLLIARADQGALPIRPEIVAVGEVFDGVADRFAVRAAGLGRRVSAPETPLAVEADRERLDQALSGLVDNALRHGDGDVVLSARQSGDSVVLHVTDEGKGFPAGFREIAFDRFSRADEARGRGGSGLGLSIVALIAAAHGGSTGADDRPGGGADVWLSVPRAGSVALRPRVRALI